MFGSAPGGQVDFTHDRSRARPSSPADPACRAAQGPARGPRRGTPGPHTTIHLAECLARVPYGATKSCTVLQDGRAVKVTYRENDHCCKRFRLVGNWLSSAGLERLGRVGHGVARLCRSRDITDAVVSRLDADPLIFLHAVASGCPDCNEARASQWPEPMSWAGTLRYPTPGVSWTRPTPIRDLPGEE